MGKLKINKDKKASKEQIDRHKNFDRFMANYKKFYTFRTTRLLYKKRRWLTLILVIIILTLILLFDKLG